MSLIGNLLGDYKPSGAYSFELYKRDKKDRTLVKPKLAEIFFLLPPEEYTMDEGYKMNVTKTIGGGWVDDFGNDFKKITITGSLYSFYFGSPATAAKQTGSFLGDFASETLNDVQTIGKKAIEAVPLLPAGLTGIYGIDEFFKLRYIVSRFRDRKKGSKYLGKRAILSLEEKQLMKKFPTLSNFILDNNDTTYDNFGFIFNDYDDGNSFEVVFNNFKARRSKEDPFTVTYTIEMTALKQVDAASKFIGPLGAKAKETYNLILKNLKDTFDTVLGEIESITDIPDQTRELWNSTISFANSLGNTWNEFIEDKRDDYSALVSDATQLTENIDLLNQDLVSARLQASIADIESEDVELDDTILDQYNAFKQMKENLIELQGLPTYTNNTEKVKVFDGEEPETNTSDIPSEVEDTDTNKNAEKDIVYYVVNQDDNLEKIAKLFYGDYKKGKIIGEVNGLLTSDFYDDALVGQSIKIPLLEDITLTGNNRNLVYSKITAKSTIKERQLQVLGTDLNLTSNRGFVVDGTGDLGILYGEECYDANIRDRLSFKAGSLNNIHIEWGIDAELGEAPGSVVLLKIIDAIESQANLDPRTEYAYIDKDNFEIEADVVRAKLITKPLTGSENIIDLDKIIPGTLI